ncbi:MAG: zinc-dependent metalloprotease family protein [Phormidesmis sp.]
MKKIVHRFIHRPFRAIAIITLSLVGCSEVATPSGQTIDFGEADRILSIQPIQVCNDSGSHCASVNMFEDITRKILEQAQLKVSFLPINQIRNSRFLKIDSGENRSIVDSEFYELSRTGGAGAFGRNPNSTRTTGPINVWFVEEIESAEGFTQFGSGWVNANGVLISEESGTFNGTGRVDTLAHEIGHNLGLRHGTLGAGSADNLLTDGSFRNIPTSVEDIGNVSSLTAAQIAEIKRSGFLTGSSTSSGTDLVLDGHSHDHPHDHPHADITQTMPVQATNLAMRSLTSTTDPISAPTRATLVSAAITSATNAAAAPKSVPEPDNWAALSLFAILIAARKHPQQQHRHE